MFTSSLWVSHDDFFGGNSFQSLAGGDDAISLFCRRCRIVGNVAQVSSIIGVPVIVGNGSSQVHFDSCEIVDNISVLNVSDIIVPGFLVLSLINCTIRTPQAMFAELFKSKAFVSNGAIPSMHLFFSTLAADLSTFIPTTNLLLQYSTLSVQGCLSEGSFRINLLNSTLNAFASVLESPGHVACRDSTVALPSGSTVSPLQCSTAPVAQPSLILAQPYAFCFTRSSPQIILTLPSFKSKEASAFAVTLTTSLEMTATSSSGHISVKGQFLLFSSVITTIVLQPNPSATCASATVNPIPQFPFAARTSLQLLASPFVFFGQNFVPYLKFLSDAAASSSPHSSNFAGHEWRDSRQGCTWTLASSCRRRERSR